MFGREIILNKVAGGGGGCTDIVDNYDPFDGGGIALYQLNGDATDVSGNYDVTNTNVTLNYASGVFGQSLAPVTTSENAYLENLSIPNYISISFWIKLNSFSVDDDRVFCYNIRDQGVDYPQIDTTNGSISLSTSDNLPTGVWTHVVVVIDGTDLVVYYNGSLQTNKTVPIGTELTRQRLISVSDTMSTSRFEIDQVRLFTVPLTPLEVEALYTEELCICDGTVDTLDILGDGSCIATYPLDGNANDLSGNYSGTPTNISYGVGEFDLGAILSGSSNYITLPSGSPFDDSDTIKAISFWAKMDGVLATFNHAFRVIGDSSHFFELIIRSDNECRISIRQGSSSNQINVETINCPKGTGVWRHYVFQLDGTQKIYIDGAEQATQVTYQTGSATTSSWISYPNYTNPVFTLGRNDGTTDFDLDQVRIFNKALNSTEVTTLFDESACAYGGRQSEGTQILGDTSCIAYYKLDGTADDETGTYDGTFTNPDYANGEFLYAGVFDGTTSYVDTGISSSLNSSFSGSMWVKPNASQTYSAIFGSGVDSANLFVIDVRNLEVGFNVDGNLPSGTKPLLSTSSFSHICFTFDNNVIKIYVNGVEELSQTVGSISFSRDFAFGARYWSGSYNGFFNGEIDQVRVFNKAVSPSDVTTLYNEGL